MDSDSDFEDESLIVNPFNSQASRKRSRRSDLSVMPHLSQSSNAFQLSKSTPGPHVYRHGSGSVTSESYSGSQISGSSGVQIVPTYDFEADSPWPGEAHWDLQESDDDDGNTKRRRNTGYEELKRFQSDREAEQWLNDNKVIQGMVYETKAVTTDGEKIASFASRRKPRNASTNGASTTNLRRWMS